MKKTVICCLLAAALVSAQTKQRIAVLPSVGDLDPQRLILLTDKVRELATQSLPVEDFNILKQDVIIKMIGEEELYRACKEGVCIGDLARKTNANYGARCDVIKLDTVLVLKFEMYSVNEEVIFETFTDYAVKDFNGILMSLETRLPEVFQKMADAPKSEVPKLVPPMPAPLPPETYTPPPPLILSEDTAAAERETRETNITPDNRPRKLDDRISFEFLIPLKFNLGFTELFWGTMMRLNLIYAELYMDFFVPGNFLSGEGPPEGPNLVTQFLAKYPLDLEYLKIYPLFGGTINVAEYPYSDERGETVVLMELVFGGRVDVGLGKMAYATTEYLYGSRSQSFKSGLGLDIRSYRGFLRLEAQYRFTKTAYAADVMGIPMTVYTKDVGIPTHAWGFHIGFGVSGKKRNRSAT